MSFIIDESSDDEPAEHSFGDRHGKDIPYQERFPLNSFLSEKVQCRRSKTHGAGLFAIDHIDQGETLIIFTGKVVKKDRLSELTEEQLMHILQIQEDFFQIPFVEKENNEVADFINHSCDPNCGFGDTAMLVAMRDIEEGEELTFDYAMSDCYNMYFKCCCGSKECRGEVTDRDWSIPALQEKYYEYFMPYLRKRIDKARLEAARKAAVAETSASAPDAACCQKSAPALVAGAEASGAQEMSA